MAISNTRNGGGKSMSLEERWAVFNFKIQASARAKFYEKMAAQLENTPLDAALRVQLKRAEEKKRPMMYLYRAWVRGLTAGETFAEASQGYLPETEIIIIGAGEKANNIGAGFLQAAVVARSATEMLKVVRSEMTTPVIQVVMLVGLLVGFALNVAPGLAKSVPSWAMDDEQRALFAMSAVVAATWFIAVPIGVGLIFLALWSLPRYTGPARKYLDKLPPWSIYRIYVASTFMIALAALLAAGQPIEAAIKFIRDKSSPWLREHLSIMIGNFRSGAGNGEALDVGLLTDDISDDIAVYATTPNFNTAMGSLGREAIKSGIENIKAKAGIARTLATVLIGLQVGWMFDSMMGIGDAATRATHPENAPKVTISQPAEPKS